MSGYKRAGYNYQGKEHNADDTSTRHVSRSDRVHPDTHDKGDGQSADDGVSAPGALHHSIYDSQGKPGKEEDKNEQYGEAGDDPGSLSYLRFGDERETFPVMAHGGEKNDHVMDRPGNYRSDDDPEGARQIAELSCQDWSEQGACRRDGRKMMSEKYILVGRVVIEAVLKRVGRSRPVGVQTQDPVRYEHAVVTVGQGKDTQGNEYKGQRIHKVSFPLLRILIMICLKLPCPRWQTSGGAVLDSWVG